MNDCSRTTKRASRPPRSSAFSISSSHGAETLVHLVRALRLDQARADHSAPSGLAADFRGISVRKKPVNVTWELLEDEQGPKSVVVDVDSPLRPFGSDPTPAGGTPMLPPLPGTQAAANALSLEDDTEDIVLPASVSNEEPAEDLK